MKTITSLLRLQIGGHNGDAMLLRTARAICFITGAFVFIVGLLKVTRLDLPDAQLFSAVQQVVQTALLFCILGSVLDRKPNTV
jgi:hypothetical protein